MQINVFGIPYIYYEKVVVYFLMLFVTIYSILRTYVIYFRSYTIVDIRLECNEYIRVHLRLSSDAIL